ncbi:MAG: DUF370 domain-containing protein [Acutalibacteraceae bacterium]|nr:DUF370 domain-containing protein [Acutalibacteraceae bacterium]
MYLHIGKEKIIKTDQIIGIFDLDTATISKATRNYLAAAEKSGDVINVTTELPKTFIVCKEDGKRTVYISQISSSTLNKRSEITNNNF